MTDAATDGRAPRFRFPKAKRVRDRRDFQRIQGRGTRLGGRLLMLLALKQGGVPGPSRLGITASRKSGDSVARSRIKRVCREVFRLNPDAFPAGWDFVVIAREGADALTMQQAADELLGALKRLKDAGPRGPRPGGPRPPSSKPGPKKPGPSGPPPARSPGKP